MTPSPHELTPTASRGGGLFHVHPAAHTVPVTEDYGTATWRYWQKIRNDAGARGSFRDRPPVAVRARVVFERDGEVWLDGTATRLGFDGAIFVELHDRRCQAIGVWLRPDDVWWAGK